VPPN